MTFGEALRAELIQVDKLDKKVFPIVAPEGAGNTFLVYKRVDTEFKKTLSGTSNKCHAIYELTIVTNNYAEKEYIEENVKNKILSFLDRSIGEDGPYIQNVTARFLSENYSFEPDLLTSSIRIEVDY